MFEIFTSYPVVTWVIAVLVALLAGVVKGIVGFAMPMILVSGLGAFLPPEIVVAGLILPTLITNGMQALRRGLHGARLAVRSFAWFLAVGGVTMALAAQLVLLIPQNAYFLLIGFPITGFVVLQIAGWIPASIKRSRRLDCGVALVAGFMGGLSGIWGPPTVTYLTALNTPKSVQMQVQGVIYGLGALILTVAHWGSGVLNANTLWLSVGLTAPAVIGMVAGTSIQDRIDQKMFRRATLIVLLLAGLNLIRRGLTG